MKVNWGDVEQNIANIPQAPSYTTKDLLATITLLSMRLRTTDHEAQRCRLDAIRAIVRQHTMRQQVQVRLVDLARECYTAGIYAAADAEYRPGNPEIARLLAEAKARLHTATPEADQSLQAPQTIGENGVTGA